MKNLFKTFLITVLLAILIILICSLVIAFFPIIIAIFVFSILWLIVYDFYICVKEDSKQ